MSIQQDSLARNHSNVMGKKREDRAVQAKTVFESVLVETKMAHTVVLLLQSGEDQVVLQALAALDKFALKSHENLNSLQELGIVENLLPLIHHSDMYIRRFSFKLIGELCALQETKSLLLEDMSYLYHFVDMYIKEHDPMIQEFASVILEELTSMHVGCANLLQTNIFDAIFIRIKSSDPDVQKNTAQIIINIMSDPVVGKQFVRCGDFDLQPLLALLLSDYPEIQNLAIGILDCLTRWHQDETMQEHFRKSHGLEEIISILETFDWKDMHHSLLGVLANIADNPQTAQYLHTSGCLAKLLQYMDDIHDATLVEDALGVIVKMANIEVGCQLLYDNHIVEMLLKYLRDESSGVAQAACMTIALLTQHHHSLEMLVSEFPVREITSLMKNEMRSWDTRQAAAYAMCRLLQADKRFCTGLLDSRRHEVMLSLLRQPAGKVPVEMLITLVNCFSALAVHEDTRTRAVEPDLFDAITNHLQGTEASDVPLRIAACMCLNSYAREATVRENFYLTGGVTKLMTCIKDQRVPLQQAATSLLQLLCSDQQIAMAFMHYGILQWMLEQKSLRFVCPSLETAIEVLFKSCLPAKFAYTRRLELEDITTEGFYITKRTQRKFPILEELLEARTSPMYPIYVVNFNPNNPIISTPTPKASHKTRSSSSSGSKRQTQQSHKSEGTLSSQEQIENLLATSYGACPSDPYLADYLERVNKLLAQGTEQNEKFGIREQVRILGQFVSDQMCGPTSGQPCDHHMLELHLQEIKMMLKTNIIPLGHIRAGMHLERALLFKVLADKLGIPCTLVRGEYGRSWVELVIPQPDPLPQHTVPIRRMRPNCIINLMNNPGRLSVIGSYESDMYCCKPV